VASAQNGHLAKAEKTALQIAQEMGVGKNTVKRAEKFADGVETNGSF